MIFLSLKKLKELYPQIEYTVVLAYMMSETTDKKYDEISLYSNGMEYVPKRFAISHRNDWMIKHSNFVICYIRNHFGGAYKCVEKAKRKKRIILNIFSEKNSPSSYEYFFDIVFLFVINLAFFYLNISYNNN